MRLEQSATGIYQVTLKPHLKFYYDESRFTVYSNPHQSNETPWSTILGYLAPKEDRLWLDTGDVGDKSLSLELCTRERIIAGTRQRILAHINWDIIDSLERVSDFSSWEELNDLTAERRDTRTNQQPTSPSDEVRVFVISPYGKLLYEGNDLPNGTTRAKKYALRGGVGIKGAALTHMEKRPEGLRVEKVHFLPARDEAGIRYARRREIFKVDMNSGELGQLVDFV